MPQYYSVIQHKEGLSYGFAIIFPKFVAYAGSDRILTLIPKTAFLYEKYVSVEIYSGNIK
jgi:hypothetical protein